MGFSLWLFRTLNRDLVRYDEWNPTLIGKILEFGWGQDRVMVPLNNESGFRVFACVLGNQCQRAA